MSSTRLAAIDVRNDGRLILSHTILSRGRTSGLYASERGSVSLGAQCAIVGMKLAGIEIESGAQVSCQTKAIATALEDDAFFAQESLALIVTGCATTAMVSRDASFGYLDA